MYEEPIDIIIPWLNPTKKWYESYTLYRENESAGRIRDLNTIRPAIKSIIKNLSWIRYIWLIVYDEEQIPNDWEELKNKKVRIVYHKDIIPKEFLPNFNSFLTLAYINNIKELSECFIKSSDDMIFMNTVRKEFFFKENTPVHRKNNVCVFNERLVNTYSHICNSTANFIQNITHKKVISNDYHMPCALSKNLISFLCTKYEKEIYESFINSKIRKPKNIAVYKAAFTLAEVFGYVKYDECIDVKQKIVLLDDRTKFSEIENAIKSNDIVCINDGEGLVNRADEIADFIKLKLNELF